ncbi:hypothetical protein CGL51_09035 [Pyrobaculum aerophilum]|uniref:Uncharacterized protein n=2 Tax=Pyrobaculum aerophilum TaxID=13773 RepID=A0A371R082_9CREN|nr:hypothetical protein CGL51_09035 [Pyrobaculum aerophilum]RFA96715.1 hypothetical protein CGL52_10755 [Pyrobaculum aerophilum]
MIYIFGKTKHGPLWSRYCETCYKYLGPGLYEKMREDGYGRLCVGEEHGWECKAWDWDFQSFKPICIQSISLGDGFSRWWFKSGGFFYEGSSGVLYMWMKNVAISEAFRVVQLSQDLPDSPKCTYSAGAGLLINAEFPVIRSEGKYLRVGPWLAWHRVLGLLDNGRWVVIGDDGLYEAVFRPTAKNPLEEFGEVGYVKVLSPFLGDLDEVQSPCGAPRLVACSEEGLRAAEALLKYIEGLLKSSGVYDVIKFLPRAWTCEKPFVIPELVEINVPNEVVADWPLGNPCPHVLRAADGDPLGLLTTRTWYFCWTP